MRIGLMLAESRGGIGRHVASLVPRFAAAGHEVTLCCPKGTVTHFDFGAAELVSDPVRLRDCDLVHAHGYRAALAARRAGLRPLVVSWHNAVLAGGPRGLLMRLGQRLVARAADLTLGASADLVDQARRYGARSARLSPVAAPAAPATTRTRADVRETLGLGDEPLVLTVGRLAPQKDYPVLLTVAARVGARHPRVAFAVAGAGPMRAKLQARIDAERLPVRLLGHRDDVPDLLAAADAFLLTSRWEARALVVQEAMQCGVPVVARAVGGIPDLVGDAGLLADDAEQLATQLDMLLAEPKLAYRLRAAGRRRAETWPDEDAVAADLLDTYASLIAARG